MGENKLAFVLCIDLGTSGPKVALVSTRGEVIDYEFEETRLILLPSGGAEQDPEEWWKAILDASRRVLGKRLINSGDIVSICVTTQWSGTVAVDQDGNHLMNAIIWLDSRGYPYVEQITDGLIKISGYEVKKLFKWIRLTGGCPSRSGKDPIAHILLIKNEYPEIYKQVYKFLEPKDFINHKLTGKFAASFDSIALHWITDNRDINNIKYDDRLIRMAGLEQNKFPELMRAVDTLAPVKKEVADVLGLRPDVNVVVGTPDVLSAMIGSGAVRDYEGHLYIGTSSWITCHVPYKKTDLLHNIASLPSALPGRYFVANEQETAGACLTYLKDNVLFGQNDLLATPAPDNTFELFDKMAANAQPGSGKVIFTPWLYGERTPVEDHAVRAGFFNQSLHTTREELVRAVFEGVAYNSKWLLRYVEAFVHRRMHTINMIGGGANSNIWCQIHADILNRNIRQVKDPIQANIRGAGLLAALALKYVNLEEISHLVPIAGIYKPNPICRTLYDELFSEFLNIYKNNRRIYARLNQK
jgi:xylulokinase